VLYRASEVASAVGGQLHGEDVEVVRVSIDSRSSAPGDLFVPVMGERDGHDFVGAAVAGGAAAYLTQKGPIAEGTPYIAVADTGKALVDLGRDARSRLPDRVVGITGSVGKTSTKDLTAAALARRFRTAASPRSFNNELGVPLTLANASADTEALVVEMGARGHGHIEALCSIARPSVGVVTVVAAAHTAMFGSLDEVARAKSELIAALPTDGTAVLNADDARVAKMATIAAGTVLLFSAAGERGADITAASVELDEDLRPLFRMQTPWGAIDVRLAARGAHAVINGLAAAGAALALGVSLQDTAEGLSRAELTPWRMQLIRTPSGLTVLNDAYNANPLSTESALRSLATLDAKRRIAVLGIMAELGPSAPEDHRRVAALAEELGIEVVAVDAPDYGRPTVTGVEGALTELERIGALAPGTAVLVKASRVAGLERLGEALARSDVQTAS
jgi:UDP-N-acetylmuramoyl-tripeptide--D-alanyl-D-alanine ligase